jgi:hypothetical protein
MFLGVVAVIPDERNRSRLPIKFGTVFIPQSEFDGDLLHTLFAYPLPKGVRSQGVLIKGDSNLGRRLHSIY